jgi:sporulation protein YlmC with PRC-barrel domain
MDRNQQGHMDRNQQGNTMARASDLMNARAQNAQGKRIGDIDELAIDPDSNRVVYGVLRRGGFLGIGESRFAVPTSELSAPRDGRLMLDMQDSDFENRDGFDNSNWPTQADQRFTSRRTTDSANQRDTAAQRETTAQRETAGQRDTAAQRETAGQRDTAAQRETAAQRDAQRTSDQAGTRPATRVVKASNVIGSTVDCTDGNKIGNIKDLIVDTSNGRVVYAIVSLDRGETPIPMSTLRASGDKYIASMNRQQIQAMPTINSDRDPNWNDAQWNRSIHQSYGTSMEASATTSDRGGR